MCELRDVTDFAVDIGFDEARIDSHLKSCAECRSARQQLVNVMTLVDSATPVEAPLGFERTAWARLEPTLLPLFREPSPTELSTLRAYYQRQLADLRG